MLLFFLLFPAISPAAVETRMLECAKALSRAHEWVVPLGGNQTAYASLYDKNSAMMHLWSEKNHRNIYFYSGEKLYVVETPPPIIKPRMVNWNYFVAAGLPGGDQYLRYNAGGFHREVTHYHLGSEEEKKSFSDQRAVARAAKPEEEKEAFGLFLDRMGYLWEMRESVKNPSWFSHVSNAGKGTTPPNAEEIQAMENGCAVFFSPDAELSCRK